MTAVSLERDASAGPAAQAPAIPDLTLPQFVLADAYRRGSKRALVDAATGDELSYDELADAVRKTAAGPVRTRAAARPRARPVRAELPRVRSRLLRGQLGRRDSHDREPAVHGG